jgi:hypothetical protein
MKKGLILSLVLIISISGVAIAGNNKLEGTWTGDATSKVCCPNASDPLSDPVCHTLTISDVTVVITQNGNLFEGYFLAEDYTHPCFGLIEGQKAFLTGTIATNKRISGVIGFPDPSNDYINFAGIGVFEGMLIGNKLKAVLRDFTDGSTTVGELYRE